MLIDDSDTIFRDQNTYKLVRVILIIVDMQDSLSINDTTQML